MKHTTWLSLVFLATLGCLIPLSVKAQVTPDGTTSTTVNQNGSNFTIEQGDRVGDNLFHSFNQFSVPTLGSAAFNNAGDIANIFSRVTGSSVSSIDGLISANGAANLFLINPNGIIFGENASLNLGGSFFASTADSLLFEGNRSFSASNPQAPPLLEVSIPIGLNFRNEPGDIVNKSIAPDPATNTLGLQVQPGKNISLIGGDVSLDGGQIFAPGGRVELSGLNAAETIGINADGSLSFPENVDKGNVFLNKGSVVAVFSEGGGSIAINSKNLELAEGSSLQAGISPGLGSPEAQAGDIVINATERVSFDGVGTNGLSSGISSSVFNQGIGNTGKIEINTKDLSFTNGGKIFSTLSGTGNLGDVIINATERVSFDGVGANGLSSGIYSSVFNQGIGNTGKIEINTKDLSFTNGGIIFSTLSGTGNLGDVIINAGNNISLDGLVVTNIPNASNITNEIAATGSGSTGNINISAKNFSLTNGASISSVNTGKGTSGNINIDASNTIFVDGSLEPFVSKIFNFVPETGVGNGGAINLSSNNLVLTNGGTISSLTSGEGNSGNITINARNNISLDGEGKVNNAPQLSNIITSVSGVGNSGNIDISTQNLSITNGASISARPNGNGNAGDINITATNSVSVDGKGSTEGSFSNIGNGLAQGARGDEGNIKVATGSLRLSNNGGIYGTSTGQGSGASITIEAKEEVFLDKGTINSSILQVSTSPDQQSSAQGNAGDISITTKNVSLINDSFLSSYSATKGNGGDIIINATETIFLDRSALITNVFGGNISEPNLGINLDLFGEGNAGNIKVNTPLLSLDQNSSLIAANTPSQTLTTDLAGGNIDLSISDQLVLRNNSRITAFANQNANGGNVTINANDGLIVAFPNQNNDITASAVEGKGGEINIFTQAIFGLEERSSTPPNQTNDIDASSEFGLQGTFSLNTPDFDPTTGLINLPASVGDASDQISQNPCQRGVGSEFLVTGKGGLPPNVNESLNSESAQVGLIESVPSQQTVGGNGETLSLGGFPDLRKVSNPKDIHANPSTTPEAVPAQGWVFNNKGEVTLTAYKTTNTGRQNFPKTTINSCSAS